MPTQSTNALLLSLTLLVAGCSSLSVPFSGSDDDLANVEATQTGTTDEGHASTSLEESASATVANLPIVPTPPLKAGNQALFDRAVELMADQQYQAAEVLLQELTASQPELAGPWVNLGNVYLVQERRDEALQAFQQALQANPKNCDAHNQMGVLARREGRFNDAERHYLDCLEANPYYSHARLNLGILYELYMGRLGEALAAYHDYQASLVEPDARVDGWVMDLERRVAAIAKR